VGEIRIAERCGFDGLDTKFQEVPFQIGVCGVPLLRWAQVSIECELWDTWSVGDHVVYWAGWWGPRRRRWVTPSSITTEPSWGWVLDPLAPAMGRSGPNDPPDQMLRAALAADVGPEFGAIP